MPSLLFTVSLEMMDAHRSDPLRQSLMSGQVQMGEGGHSGFLPQDIEIFKVEQHQRLELLQIELGDKETGIPMSNLETGLSSSWRFQTAFKGSLTLSAWQ